MKKWKNVTQIFGVPLKNTAIIILNHFPSKKVSPPPSSVFSWISCQKNSTMMGSQLVVLRIFCLGKFWCPGNWGSEMIARLETCRAAYLYIYIWSYIYIMF